MRARWQEMSKVRRVALVVYGLGLFTYIVLGSIILLSGRRGYSWFFITGSLWLLTWIAFDAIWRRRTAKAEVVHDARDR